jgi:hypothetical protein
LPAANRPFNAKIPRRILIVVKAFSSWLPDAEKAPARLFEPGRLASV